MSFTVGQVSNAVLHQMREYSNAGAIQSDADIKDYMLSVIPLLNLFVPELATTTHKKESNYKIAQNMPDNLLGLYSWNEEKVHIGGVDDEYIVTGCKAFSIQVSGRATITIYEEIASVWTSVRTITHTPASGEGYATYKGLTNIADSSNRVKLVLSGNYRYTYRWVGLFSDTYYEDVEVPTFEPYVPYLMPTNFYQTKEIVQSHPNRQLTLYTEYQEDFTTDTKNILINWYEKGEFTVKYYAYPSTLALPDPTNISASNSLIVDIADECMPVLVHKICATLLRDENPYMSDTLREEAQITKSEILQNSNDNSGQQSIIINSNW